MRLASLAAVCFFVFGRPQPPTGADRRCKASRSSLLCFRAATRAGCEAAPTRYPFPYSGRPRPPRGGPPLSWEPSRRATLGGTALAPGRPLTRKPATRSPPRFAPEAKASGAKLSPPYCGFALKRFAARNRYLLSRINFSLTTTRSARSTIRNSKSEKPSISPSISSRIGLSASIRIEPPRNSETLGIS